MGDKKQAELMKLDLYKLLDVSEDASPKQIKKAFRRKALDCHPDKNPDNPKAAELFHQLSEALKILSDLGARAAYDHLRKARRAAKERNDKLDSHRKKFKLDLEARERAAEINENKATTTLKQKIERLREEGSRILEEEQRRMREEIKKAQRAAEATLEAGDESGKLKLGWKSDKKDPNNGGYSHDLLIKILSKHGKVENLLMSKRKTGSAIVEFASARDAEQAVEVEPGLPTNPLKISWISGNPEERMGTSSRSFKDFRNPIGGERATQDQRMYASSYTSSSGGEQDFETTVLLRLKREQERKRQLAQELKNEENDDE